MRIQDLEKHQKELLELYIKFSNRVLAKKMEHTVKELVNPRNNNLNEHISRIKKSFEKVLGKSAAKYFYIKGKRGARKAVG